MTVKVASIVGARPQFIKVGIISRAIAKHNQSIHDSQLTVHHVLVHTGQHYDYEMSHVFFDELNLKNPDYHLGIGSGTHGEQTGTMLKIIEEVLLKERPNVTVVYGDTNSTLAGALAASKLHIPVAHVEAGLRSFNKSMPEEINRILTDHVSKYLFCPTETAVRNLKREGITNGVFLVGDVMYDSAIYYLKIAEQRAKGNKKIEALKLNDNAISIHHSSFTIRQYYLVTIHRPENTDNVDRLQNILQALNELDLPVVLPLHPRTRKVIKNHLMTQLPNNLNIIPPVSYLDMLILEKNAKAILTDSGGIQKEAYFFQIPCITFRDETEWVETSEGRWNITVGTDKKRISEAIYQLSDFKPDKAPFHFGEAKRSNDLDISNQYIGRTNRTTAYGDGNAAEKIIQNLLLSVSS